ncbi:MAG: YdcF family protein [Rhizobiaceae bacterium]|nr:YdcF family protein [Rhizobiaceae bacterium]
MKDGIENTHSQTDKQVSWTFSTIVNYSSRLLFLVLISVGIFLLAGFLRFSMTVADYDNTGNHKADGIVVLTGGKSRIETGLDLLNEGRGKRMLISGVNPETSVNAIIARFSKNSNLFSCCIDLDRVAMDTIQNGREAAKWIKKQGFKSVLVVTSDYHMPRGLLEMSRAISDVSLIPFVAQNEQEPARSNLGNPGHLRNMVSEYFKFIAASINSRFFANLVDSNSGNQNMVAN